MRVLLATVVLSVLPVAAFAQSSEGVRLPDITPRLPRIGLPLPRIALSPVAETRTVRKPVDRGPEKSLRHRFGHRKGHRFQPGLVVIPVFTPVMYVAEPTAPPEEPATVTARAAVPQTGELRFDVQPSGGWQVSVDGFYVGTSDDVAGGLEVEAGSHTVEIRAEGYEPLVFDVMVTPGRTVTCEGAMTPARSDSTARPRSPARSDSAPIYLIPGCYIGNVAPKDARLPADCDPEKAVIVKP